jgi:DNA-binding NarL/FixJ family response regulator
MCGGVDGHGRSKRGLSGPVLPVKGCGLLADERSGGMHPEGAELTPRLLDVLHLVAEGRTTDEIAGTLGLSPFTVKNYMERIFERLGARDRAEAVAIALRSGLLK